MVKAGSQAREYRRNSVKLMKTAEQPHRVERQWNYMPLRRPQLSDNSQSSVPTESVTSSANTQPVDTQPVTPSIVPMQAITPTQITVPAETVAPTVSAIPWQAATQMNVSKPVTPSVSPQSFKMPSVSSGAKRPSPSSVLTSVQRNPVVVTTRTRSGRTVRKPTYLNEYVVK